MTESVGGRNPALSRVRRLARDRAFRRREGAYLVEGPTLVGEALAAGLGVDLVLVPADAAPSEVVAAAEGSAVPCRLVDDALFDGLTTTRSSQPALAVVERHDVPVADLPVGGVVVVLAELADPGNAGTLVRSAEAFGASGMVFAGGVDPYNPKCVRATAGSLFRLPFAVIEGEDAVGQALERLEASGRHCWGSVAEGGVAPTEVPDDRSVALLLGNEPHGLSEAVVGRCAGLVTVATTGVGESLNVAVAGSVLLYALATR